MRLIEKSDAEALWELVDRNRGYLRKWLPWLDFNSSITDTAKFIEDCIEQRENNKSLVYVIENNGICGVCGFNSFNHTIKAGYIGYWLSENSQGRGLVANSIVELERVGFGELGLNKIEIHVATGNTRSRNVALRLEYVETGTLLDAELLYGEYVDHVVYCKRAANKAPHRSA